MNTLKKPPDKYKCIKVHFSSLLKDNIDYSIIFDSIIYKVYLLGSMCEIFFIFMNKLTMFSIN